MATFTLSPTSDALSQEYVLVQAWKKAHDYIRRHNWYADVLALDLTNANLEIRLDEIATELRSSPTLRSDALRLILAPKSQAWDVDSNEWKPVGGPSSVANKLRPLAHVSVRDQIIATAFMILFADVIENRQGDPRMTALKARERKMVSYGHRLFCDMHGTQLRYRWGNSVVYRRYFQDYQAFVARPQEIVDELFPTSTDWAVVYADLSQFYDRVRPNALHAKIEQVVGAQADAALLERFRSFFNWTWYPQDQGEALAYAKTPKPQIDGFNQIALPQGLVASGFFANAFLLDFDDAVCKGIDQSHDENKWQLIDFCRYVDDMRIVVRLGEGLREASEKEVSQIISNHLIRLLDIHAPGLTLNPKKSFAVLGRDAAAGSIRVSATMKRINQNTSGVADLFAGQETLDLIEGLFFARDENPLVFEDKFHDTFFAAKPDVRDDSVARFAANRFRRTYRSLRPLCDDNPTTTENSLLPSLSRDFLDDKAAHFCRRLIERWVRDPSNMRLLRVALDIRPDVKSLEVVLDLLVQYVGPGGRRNAPRRVAWYCAAELLKAGATETGLVNDADCLPSDVIIERYQERLTDFAALIVERLESYPWYLVQQALLYLASVGRFIDRTTSNPYLSEYFRLHAACAGRTAQLRKAEAAAFVLLQSRLRGNTEAAKTFLACFRESGTPTQRRLLLRILKESEALAAEIRQQMSADEQVAWGHLYLSYGLLPSDGFPETAAALPEKETSYSFLAVSKSALNPFRQEYAALKFVRPLLKRLVDRVDNVFPSRIRISAKNWRALCSDRFPIDDGSISVDFEREGEGDARFEIPAWINPHDAWKYQLGQLLRVLLTGVVDYTVSARPTHRGRSHVLYSPYSSSWLRRRYGLFNGRSAFGPPWLPISSWIGSLLSRLLEWPGFARFELDFTLPEDFDAELLTNLICDRISELDHLYGRASYTPVLPMRAPKAFLQPSESDETQKASLYSLRVGVVQTVIPREGDFAGDPELNNPPTRLLHRRHLSAVLGAVHRMLQVRETHRNNGSGIELLILPELAVHQADLPTHIEPFVYQHRCMVFAGIVFNPPAPGQQLINSGSWIIPVRTPYGGVQIEYIAQGKWNLTPDEVALGIAPFRPAQWLLQLVDPANLQRLWSMSGSICYDSTDLRLAADLRDCTDMFIIPALNHDVGTFDTMAAALHYHMFQHVIVANCGQFGGSTGQAPFANRHNRTIFHSHGNDHVTISFFEVDMTAYRDGAPLMKTPPAGFRGR